MSEEVLDDMLEIMVQFEKEERAELLSALLELYCPFCGEELEEGEEHECEEGEDEEDEDEDEDEEDEDEDDEDEDDEDEDEEDEE